MTFREKCFAQQLFPDQSSALKQEAFTYLRELFFNLCLRLACSLALAFASIHPCSMFDDVL